MVKSDFLWGSASAAYQVEGASLTNGKGPSIWDTYSHIKGNTYKDTNGDVAVDFYHRFEEDILLMKEQGLQAYRFSVAWSRILPNGKGEINQEGIDFYLDVINLCNEYGIEPIVTLYHWDLPQALQDEYGGWESRNIIDDFTNYCEILFKAFKGKVKYWVTLNEQNVFTGLGYLYELHPPKHSDYQLFLNVNHYANLANAKVIKRFNELGMEGHIAPSFAYGPCYSASANPIDILASEHAEYFINNFWLDVYLKGVYPTFCLEEIKKAGYSIDLTDSDKILLKEGVSKYIGINYYQTNTYQSPLSGKIEEKKLENTVQSTAKVDIHEKLFVKVDNQYLKTTDWNWAIDPIGLKIGLERITARYNVPIMITENGLGAYDEVVDGQVNDDYRIDYLRQHIKAIEEAVDNGVEMIGYCTWSFTDLFSWLNGYGKRYGFVYVNRDEESEKDLKRIKKKSFYFYKDVIEKNGLGE